LSDQNTVAVKSCTNRSWQCSVQWSCFAFRRAQFRSCPDTEYPDCDIPWFYSASWG